MANSLFNSLMQVNPAASNFLNQFNNFSSMFRGNPQAQVQNLIQNGSMTQEQFNQYAQIANKLRPLIK